MCIEIMLFCHQLLLLIDLTLCARQKSQHYQAFLRCVCLGQDCMTNRGRPVQLSNVGGWQWIEPFEALETLLLCCDVHKGLMHRGAASCAG